MTEASDLNEGGSSLRDTQPGKSGSSSRHTLGLHRGYADNVRVEWERRGKGGHSSITLLNAKKRPVAVLLGDYIPGEIDADMEAAANLFSAAHDLLWELRRVTELLASSNRSTDRPSDYVSRAVMDARAAISRATGEA